MKKTLIQHIKQVFEALKIQTEYSVYDSVNDILPNWLQNVEIKYNFVICCEATFEKKRLEGFINKEIINFENYYYWFEGEKIESTHQSLEVNVEPHYIQSKEKLKTTTRLSSWLDNFIFNTLHAEYAPDYQKFEYNLNLKHEDNLKYLGTYFPRSYAETFCIFDNLFSNEAVKSKYATIKEVNVLSVGCGTGGDIIGLLTIINKHFASIKKVEVVAVDGNIDALNILSQIIQQFNLKFRKKVILITKQIVFDEITTIGTKYSFDFIITSKMINEIIKKGNGRFDNSYYDFANIYSSMLKYYGIIMILDVTSKDGMPEYCPILLNKQINQFVHHHPDYVSIIPIPCAEKANCQELCFSQKEFSVTHSQFVNDKSRVAYRILFNKAFYKELKLHWHDTQFQIQPDKCCGQGSIIADGFFLPNTKEQTDTISKDAIRIPNSKLNPTHNGAGYTSNDANIFQQLNEETNNCILPKHLGEAYIIDTNAFVYAPNIIEKISDDCPIFVSAKVVDELDHLKDVTSGNEKKKTQKALKSINLALSNRRIQTVASDASLLPADFSRRSPDNLILSVALKLKKMGYSPILVTSDNGFQIKAKTLKIKTISYTKIKQKN